MGLTFDQFYIKRCIKLAKNGLGTTYPNPMVGCVVVYNQKIIGEGWHKKAGYPHAEVNAINSVKNKEFLKQSTIYVGLEPCSHFGKTPPCTDLILKHKIPRVVIGTIDPFAEVRGNGVAKLQKAGIEVKVGVLEQECNELNKRFFTFHQKKRPYIVLKWAQTQNGFVAPLRKNKQKPTWISNEFSRQLVHKWRSEEQAILVGTNTVLSDNPKLNLREWAGQNPIKIVLDKELKIPKNYSIYQSNEKTIFITEKNQPQTTENIIFETIDFQNNRNKQILEVLHKHQIQSVIIEGGTRVLDSFIKDNLWDEARVFVSDVFFENGIKAPDFNFRPISKTPIQYDVFYLFLNEHSK